VSRGGADNHGEGQRGPPDRRHPERRDLRLESENGVNVYEWGGKRCVGLSGHVVGVDFPSEYSDWRDVEPVELIDASVEKTATKENIVATLRLLARRANRVAIATDYDREGS